ncbi:MAG: hypothetical protein ACON4Z_09610, partial [Planctomycetota bacterium]
MSCGRWRPLLLGASFGLGACAPLPPPGPTTEVHVRNRPGAPLWLCAARGEGWRPPRPLGAAA